jgi:hypothetical protein
VTNASKETVLARRRHTFRSKPPNRIVQGRYDR